jgi:nuclear pore complex protein Nup188
LTTLRDTLLRPVSESLISPTKVRQLLQYHLEKLHNPATPFKRKDSASRASLQGSSITLPRTTVQLDVDRPSRSLALRLADAADVDEITAFVLWRSYAAHSLEAAATPAHGQSHEDALLERLVLWYEQELLAAPQIVMALYVPPAEPTGWEDAAVQLRENVLGDQAEYIEGLFRTFSTLAQQPVETENMLSRGLFW